MDAFERIREALEHDTDHSWCYTCHEPLEQCPVSDALAALEELRTAH